MGSIAKQIITFLLVCLMISLIYGTFSSGIDGIKGFFGIDTVSSVKYNLVKSNNTIEDLVSINTKLLKDLNNSKKINVIRETAINKYRDKIKNNEKTKTKLNEIIKEATKKINSKSENKIDDIDNFNKTSTVHINSIWKTYCNQQSSTHCNNFNR